MDCNIPHHVNGRMVDGHNPCLKAYAPEEPSGMKTSSAKDPQQQFDELPAADRAVIIRQLEELLEPRIAKNLTEAKELRLAQRSPSVN